jgi:hypothetical protein
MAVNKKLRYKKTPLSAIANDTVREIDIQGCWEK